MNTNLALGRVMRAYAQYCINCREHDRAPLAFGLWLSLAELDAVA